MFSVYLIVCFSLIYGITSKPHKPWNKIDDAAFQNSVTKEERKLSSEVVVEPPQNKDVTDYDIDPGMTIWKTMEGIGQDRQYLFAEADTDQFHHPSLAELLHGQIQALNEPEQHVDEVYRKAKEELHVHLHPLGTKPNVEQGHMKLEEAIDHLNQADIVPAGGDIQAEARVRLHLEPEEDHDDLYHAEQVNPADTPVQMGKGKQLPIIDWPAKRKYSQPEEDLDGLYHN